MPTPRSEGLLMEALALKAACTTDSDLLALANDLYNAVTSSATSAGSFWRLYIPSFLGGYQAQADAIADEYTKRHGGTNPLDIETPAPTGTLADLANLASGDVVPSASAGADASVDALKNIPIPSIPSPSVIFYVIAGLVGVVLVLLLSEDARAWVKP